ncbi:MAG TPA: efflux transporter outer membrane subunit [Steroidobacteraceae bacterium]|nr:efflux transporter outer membrane subunit [Steroidobacteraceae bacterium]
MLPAILTLAACAVGPTYHRPGVASTPVYKENQGWKPATPREIPANQPWWSIYNDPVLDGLERQVQVSNQTLKASEAAYREALAVVSEERGTLLPSISATGSGTRSGEGAGVLGAQAGTAGIAGFPAASSGYIHQSTISVEAQASWTLDVWGRIRRQIQADVALAQASAADVAAARLSAQVTLAEDYFQMRTAEQEQRIYQTYLDDLENALRITQNQVRAGITTLADVYAAQTQLENTQVSDINVQLTRATYEHAIAVLIGKPPDELSLSQGALTTTVPVVPVGLPSDLLERRPDIAAAERTVASQNALIGVAESAWFPDLTLTASAGYTASSFSKLFRASNSLWSFGPSVAETLFNGGARLAADRAARAAYDESVADYRQTVLSAFQSVENDLVTLRVLERSDGLQVTAVGAARLSEQLTLNQYTAGIVAYSSVLTAQTTRLASEISLLAIQSSQLVASVDLVSQVGGGWSAGQLDLADRGVPAH